MSQHIAFAPTPLLINNPSERFITYFDDDFNEVAPTAATIARINGHAPYLYKNTIADVKAARANEGSVETITLDASNITVATTIPQGVDVRVAMKIGSINTEAEYASIGGFSDIVTYQVRLMPGDTSAEFLAKLYNRIAFSDYSMSTKQSLSVPSEADATAAPANGTFDSLGRALTLDSLQISTAGTGLYFYSGRDGFEITSIDNRNIPSPFVQFNTTAVAAITTKGYEGRGNYDTLKGVFTEYETEAYTYNRYETPRPGELYASFRFTTYLRDAHVGGVSIPNQLVSAKTVHQIYISETAAPTILNDFADFLSGATTINAPEFFNEADPMVAEAVADFKV